MFLDGNFAVPRWKMTVALACASMLVSAPAFAQNEPYPANSAVSPESMRGPGQTTNQTTGQTTGQTGQTSIPIATPDATEVTQAERPWLNPQTTPTVAVEEPLDPKTYIVSRGDSFELNFWGRQNFKLRITVDLEGRA